MTDQIELMDKSRRRMLLGFLVGFTAWQIPIILQEFSKLFYMEMLPRLKGAHIISGSGSFMESTPLIRWRFSRLFDEDYTISSYIDKDYVASSINRDFFSNPIPFIVLASIIVAFSIWTAWSFGKIIKNNNTINISPINDIVTFDRYKFVNFITFNVMLLIIVFVGFSYHKFVTIVPVAVAGFGLILFYFWNTWSFGKKLKNKPEMRATLNITKGKFAVFSILQILLILSLVFVLVNYKNYHFPLLRIIYGTFSIFNYEMIVTFPEVSGIITAVFVYNLLITCSLRRKNKRNSHEYNEFHDKLIDYEKIQSSHFRFVAVAFGLIFFVLAFLFCTYYLMLVGFGVFVVYLMRMLLFRIKIYKNPKLREALDNELVELNWLKSFKFAFLITIFLFLFYRIIFGLSTKAFYLGKESLPVIIQTVILVGVVSAVSSFLIRERG